MFPDMQSTFCDHGDAGYGTLKGIQSKVSYLKDLGVDIVWLSPIYASPNKDMGYDISDYRDIDSRYGTLQDWEELKEEVHSQGMKLVMDLVVNHTSDQVSSCPMARLRKLIQSMLGSKSPDRL